MLDILKQNLPNELPEILIAILENCNDKELGSLTSQVNRLFKNLSTRILILRGTSPIAKFFQKQYSKG